MIESALFRSCQREALCSCRSQYLISSCRMEHFASLVSKAGHSLRSRQKGQIRFARGGWVRSLRFCSIEHSLYSCQMEYSPCSIRMYTCLARAKRQLFASILPRESITLHKCKMAAIDIYLEFRDESGPMLGLNYNVYRHRAQSLVHNFE